MPDNTELNPGTGGDTIASDDIGGVKFQRVKICTGADGSADDVSSSAPVPVTGTITAVTSITNVVHVDDNASTLSIDDGAGSITIDGTLTAVTTVGTITNVVHVDDNSGNLSIDDGGNSITVDNGGTFATQATCTNAGTFAVQAACTNAGTFATQSAITAASGSIQSGAIASGAVASGAFASGALASGSVASGAIASGAIASGAIAAGAIAAGATSIAENEDVASADGDRGVKMLVRRTDTPANTSGTSGDYEFLQTSGGYLWTYQNKGMSNRAFAVTFATLTRPANTTAYAALDSISNNATAGSVSALISGNISDVNDDPIFLSEVLVVTTDTGLAGRHIRAYIYNSDPTASSGVSGGDNAAFANAHAGYLGSFSGVMETGFTDGAVGRLVPTYADGAAVSTPHAPAGGFVVCPPVSGARTLYIQYQAVDSFTPSANSTTLIGTAKGWQGRAI